MGKSMNDYKPIVIGITGHRELREQDIPRLRQTVKEQLQAVVLKCPNSPVKLLTSLAEGADQLCAEIALELNIGLIVALPMEIAEYKLDFHSGALLNFEKLIAQAESVYVAPKTEKEGQATTRDYYYRQADIYIATHSHCLIALWDGLEAKSGGCGTAETVDIALNYSFESERCVRHQDSFVIHIMTPRTSEANNAGEVIYLGNEETFIENITKLDELNKDGGNPDELSVKYGKKYHKALMRLAVLGTVLAMAFLLYDEAMMKWMMIVVGVVLIFMSFAFKLAKKSKSHEKYIEYRALAECIRVQNHLNHCGIDLEVSEYLDWTRRFDSSWIHKAIQALNITRTIDYSEDIKRDWIADQEKYHEKAAAKTEKQLKRNNKIVKIALVASIAIYIFALLFEYVISNQISTNVEFIRMILKIAVGTASAASLFAANYYGKLSLKRVYEDHIRMAQYFKSAAEYLDKNEISKKFIVELVNEELSENSNWGSYEKDNEINLDI